MREDHDEGLAMIRPLPLLLPPVLLAMAACVGTPVPVERIALSAPAERAARDAAAYDMFDPGSAQFREVRGWRSAAGDTVVCGQVNAKNRFGAYVGFRDFYVRLAPDGAVAKRYVNGDAFGVATAGCEEAAGGSVRVVAGT